MRHATAAQTSTRRSFRPTAVGLVVVAAAVIGILTSQSASSSATSLKEAQAPEAPRAAPPSAPSSAPSLRDVEPTHRRPTTEEDGVVTEDDGALPDGVTVFDDEFRGVANLDPDLLAALRDATTDAADDGIELFINSGWRSAEYQNQLLRDAVNKYGSEKEAARWVATADTSAHVSGDAVDVGGIDATAWLSEHGAQYGLCQIYRNEPWHYELRSEAIDGRCPRMYTDSAHDRTIQR